MRVEMGPLSVPISSLPPQLCCRLELKAESLVEPPASLPPKSLLVASSLLEPLL